MSAGLKATRQQQQQEHASQEVRGIKVGLRAKGGGIYQTLCVIAGYNVTAVPRVKQPNVATLQESERQRKKRSVGGKKKEMICVKAKGEYIFQSKNILTVKQ